MFSFGDVEWLWLSTTGLLLLGVLTAAVTVTTVFALVIGRGALDLDGKLKSWEIATKYVSALTAILAGIFAFLTYSDQRAREAAVEKAAAEAAVQQQIEQFAATQRSIAVASKQTDRDRLQVTLARDVPPMSQLARLANEIATIPALALLGPGERSASGQIALGKVSAVFDPKWQEFNVLYQSTVRWVAEWGYIEAAEAFRSEISELLSSGDTAQVEESAAKLAEEARAYAIDLSSQIDDLSKQIAEATQL